MRLIQIETGSQRSTRLRFQVVKVKARPLPVLNAETGNGNVRLSIQCETGISKIILAQPCRDVSRAVLENDFLRLNNFTGSLPICGHCHCETKQRGPRDASRPEDLFTKTFNL